MDKKDLNFSDIPIAYLKQERDVCEKILAEFHYYPDPEKISLKLLELKTPDIESLGFSQSISRVVSILSRLDKIVGVIKVASRIEIDDSDEAVVFIKPDTNKLKDYIKILEEEISQRELSIPSTTLDDQNSNQSEWGWLNKRKSIYQFGKETFQQGGKKKREKVFKEAMDLYERHKEIDIQTLAQRTNLEPHRVRIELIAIGKRLMDKIGFYFKGSRKGYYTIEKSPKKQTPISR